MDTGAAPQMASAASTVGRNYTLLTVNVLSGTKAKEERSRHELTMKTEI